ncbi:SHOCT domain-containing protein [Bacillus sp. JJ1562]|uniref:SHOCT domain-containing protein n=1 Tax=Bacillus sp. JJ1562 TaxID=3122960 RepID=UPI0030037297
MSEERYEFPGANGTVIVTPTKVTLKHSRFLGAGKGVKEIRIKSISGIQLKKAGLTAGYIQFVYSGSSDSQGRKTKDIMNDENTIICNKRSHYEGMVKAKALIEKFIERAETSNATTAELSQADELKKFAELRDAGVISDDEFTAKKKQILGL